MVNDGIRMVKPQHKNVQLVLERWQFPHQVLACLAEPWDGRWTMDSVSCQRSQFPPIITPQKRHFPLQINLSIWFVGGDRHHRNTCEATAWEYLGGPREYFGFTMGIFFIIGIPKHNLRIGGRSTRVTLLNWGKSTGPSILRRFSCGGLPGRRLGVLKVVFSHGFSTRKSYDSWL